MHRQAHYIKRATGNRFPQQCIAIGVELERREVPEVLHFGDSWQPHLAVKRIAAIRWRYEKGQVCRVNEFFGTDITNFWSWLRGQLRAGTLTWLFSNDLLTNATCLGLWKEFEEGLFTLAGIDPQVDHHNGKPIKRPWRGYAVIENPPTIICARAGKIGGVVRMVDIRNYGYASTLELKTAQDLCREAHRFAAEWIDFLQSNNLGTLQATAASQAMFSYRHSFMPECTLFVHDNEMALELERDSLFAGRCECRKIGTVYDLVHLDVQSMYPAIAAACKVPTVLLHFDRNGEDWPNYFFDTDISITVDCDIETAEPFYPKRIGKEIMWPTGRFRTTLADPEFRLAMNCRAVRKVHRYVAHETRNVFKEFVEFFWGEKQNAANDNDKPFVNVAKNLLVSLFGKFAQRSKRWISAKGRKADIPFESWWEVHPETRLPVQWRSFAWAVEYQSTIGEHPQSIPAITAYINSAARVRLLHLIHHARWSNVFYYDTDSLWVNEEGYELLNESGLIRNGDLGALKQKATHEKVEFRGIKHYVADGRTVCAGIPPGVEMDYLKRAKWENVEQIKSTMWSGRASQPNLNEINAHFRKEYRHGFVRSNGDVVPHMIQEW